AGGTVLKDAGAGTAAIQGIAFTNLGTVSVTSGTLALNTSDPGSDTDTGRLSTGPAGVIALVGGVRTLTGTVPFAGTGLVQLSGTALNVNAPAAIAHLAFSNGLLQGTSPVTVKDLHWSGGVMSGGTSTVIPTGGSASFDPAGG